MKNLNFSHILHPRILCLLPKSYSVYQENFLEKKRSFKLIINGTDIHPDPDFSCMICEALEKV
jgi:hypothetical protein